MMTLFRCAHCRLFWKPVACGCTLCRYCFIVLQFCDEHYAMRPYLGLDIPLNGRHPICSPADGFLAPGFPEPVNP